MSPLLNQSLSLGKDPFSRICYVFPSRVGGGLRGDSIMVSSELSLWIIE